MKITHSNSGVNKKFAQRRNLGVSNVEDKSTAVVGILVRCGRSWYYSTRYRRVWLLVRECSAGSENFDRCPVALVTQIIRTSNSPCTWCFKYVSEVRSPWILKHRTPITFHYTVALSSYYLLFPVELAAVFLRVYPCPRKFISFSKIMFDRIIFRQPTVFEIRRCFSPFLFPAFKCLYNFFDFKRLDLLVSVRFNVLSFIFSTMLITYMTRYSGGYSRGSNRVQFLR